jgi:hypothetical protein
MSPLQVLGSNFQRLKQSTAARSKIAEPVLFAIETDLTCPDLGSMWQINRPVPSGRRPFGKEGYSGRGANVAMQLPFAALADGRGPQIDAVTAKPKIAQRIRSNAELSRAGHGVSGNTPPSHGVGWSALLGMVTPAAHKTTIGCQKDPRTQNI